ncbi:MAG TPA: helix-turn-helix transcriptional regulator [Chitinophaga sp.]|uniref:helix-turn-helix transcriptional regulator n=1 Tax=Chitinophaga sp. TaxID=1869181 RepID=UPI002BDA7CE6|nr:helix-turn-helix transcriptional regulator [Chitinophaga sp.]HVI45299.1 helix-turn-helix transcriptional regulator [Chitinophaga sp.]
MKYQEIAPGEQLRPYVKCYYIFESEANIELDDTVFPGSHMEIIFNLGEGIWQSSVNKVFYTTPQVELWGKLTQPLPVRASGKNVMLGVRFYAHSAAYFLQDELSQFNDQVSDLRDLLGEPVRTLHARLREVSQLSKRIALIETFLLDLLAQREGKARQLAMVEQIIREMQPDTNADKLEAIASRYNISSRYMRKLFLQYTGVSPKLYNKITRFKLSLQLITENQSSLTSIAYDCGYFDQSHFIRDFKSFAGLTPSDYSPESYPVGQTISTN